MLQARYHGFVTSDGAFIIYTFLLLCVPFSPDAVFIYEINQPRFVIFAAVLIHERNMAHFLFACKTQHPKDTHFG